MNQNSLLLKQYMTFMWRFCHNFCRITILHSWQVISDKKADIIFFLFFHMLYWVIFNSIIILLVWKEIHLNSYHWNLFMTDLIICLLYCVRFVIFHFWIFYSMSCQCRTYFLFIQFEDASYTSFWIESAVISSSCLYCLFDCCSCSLLDCLLNCSFDCSSTCECLVNIYCFCIFSIV